MALAFAGNGTITGLSVGGLPDGTVDEDTLANNAVGSGKLASGVGGKVLQCVSTTMTTGFTTTASSPTQITGLSCAITPSASTSKVLVMVTCGLVALPSGGYFGHWELRRGTSTAIAIGDQVGSNRPRRTGGWLSYDTNEHALNFTFLDSPNTTSATTFYVYAFAEASGTLSINQYAGDYDHAIQGARGASTMTLMEIGA